jgi:hypothetical protein
MRSSVEAVCRPGRPGSLKPLQDLHYGDLALLTRLRFACIHDLNGFAAPIPATPASGSIFFKLFKKKGKPILRMWTSA